MKIVLELYSRSIVGLIEHPIFFVLSRNISSGSLLENFKDKVLGILSD